MIIRQLCCTTSTRRASKKSKLHRHRILLTYEAEAENVTSDKIIDNILRVVPVP